MTQSVSIKDVGSEYIYLENINVSKLNILKSLGLFILLSIIGTGLLSILNLVSPSQLPVIMILGGGIIFSCLIMITFVIPIDLASDLLPAYNIKLSGVFGKDKVIIKTTPEIDQKAICEAVQELEILGLELEKKKKELEQIACKCK